ncbi:hypothetical protein BGZ80_005068 [Entomortierella chlamydospora]|uniref:Acid phosphatase n=1 Tax=Entomortierella chlamydospora TaxID=101097 RepID=A0A9P6N124_9FUNG|nr:hypothetical protein BGZ79_006131 [Entomortierella chlamydospora]KAG0019917.1 hypothetical protein BGZ80_005068 [Entomortierella chlamydospora]
MVKFTSPLVLLAATALASAAPKGKWFDSIGIIMAENEDFLLTIQQLPYQALISQGLLATNYFGLSHTSEQNYAAILTGVLDPNIYRGDASTPANLNITYPTILDQLKANGLTYKQYTESYPGGCYLADMYPDDPVTALYYKRHSPFNMVSALRGTPECTTAIGTYDDFAKDVASGSLPNYFWIIPNDLHNTHTADTSPNPFVDADPWTATEGPKWLAAAQKANALFINTWDESRCDNQKYPCGDHKDQQIATILWGPMVQKNTTSDKYWNHFSIARTVEDNWGLKPLSTADANATAFDFLMANPSNDTSSSSGSNNGAGSGRTHPNVATSLVKASIDPVLMGAMVGLLSVFYSAI